MPHVHRSATSDLLAGLHSRLLAVIGVAWRAIVLPQLASMIDKKLSPVTDRLDVVDRAHATTEADVRVLATDVTSVKERLGRVEVRT
jgi:hypothetical protein